MQNPIISLRNFRNHEFGYPISENKSGGGCTFDKELAQFFKDAVNDGEIIRYNGLFRSNEHSDLQTRVLSRTFDVTSGKSFIEFRCELNAMFEPLGPNGEDYSSDTYTNEADEWDIMNAFLVKCIGNGWIDAIYVDGDMVIKGSDITSHLFIHFNKLLVNLYPGNPTVTYKFKITFKDVCGNKRPGQSYEEKDWTAIYNVGFEPNGFPEVVSFTPRIGYYGKDGSFVGRDVNDYDKDKFKYLGGQLDYFPVRVPSHTKDQSFIFSIDASKYQLGFLDRNPENAIGYNEGYPGLIDRMRAGLHTQYQYMGEQKFWEDLRRYNSFVGMGDDNPYDNRFTVLYIAKAPEDENVLRNMESYLPKPNNDNGGWPVLLQFLSGRFRKLNSPGEFVNIPELFPCLLMVDTKSGRYCYMNDVRMPGIPHGEIKLDEVRKGENPMFVPMPVDPEQIKNLIPPQYHSQIEIH